MIQSYHLRQPTSVEIFLNLHISFRIQLTCDFSRLPSFAIDTLIKILSVSCTISLSLLAWPINAESLDRNRRKFLQRL